MGACFSSGVVYFLSASYEGSENDQNVYEVLENQLHRQLCHDEATVLIRGLFVLMDFYYFQ